MKKIAIFSLISLYSSFLGAAPAPIEVVAQAVMKGNISVVQNFVFEGGNVNEMVIIPPQFPARLLERFHGLPEVTLLVLWALGDHETTLLHLAVANLQPAITNLLLDEGANINATDGNGRTPLLDAIMLLPFVRLERTNIAANISSLFNRKQRKEISKEAFVKMAYLHIHFHAMSALTVGKACFGIIRRKQELMIEGLEQTISRLLATPGVAVNTIAEGTLNPLYEAIKGGERDVVEGLIAAGANPFLKVGGTTARELAKSFAQESDDPELASEMYELVKSSPIQPPPRPYLEQATRRLGALYNHLTGGR